MCSNSTTPVSSSSKQLTGGAPPRALFISSAIFISIFVVTFFLLTLLAFCCRRRDRTNSGHSVRRVLSSDGGRSAFPVESLPTFAYSRLSGEHGGGGECAVCLGVVQEGEMVRQLPVCMHVYHVECIDQWLAAHRTCPLCRSELDPVKVATPPVPVQQDPTRPPV